MKVLYTVLAVISVASSFAMLLHNEPIKFDYSDAMCEPVVATAPMCETKNYCPTKPINWKNSCNINDEFEFEI